MNRYRLLLLFLFAAAAAGTVRADHPGHVEKALARAMPGVTVDGMRAAPVPGLYEVTLGTQVIYATTDGKYLLTGDLIDLRKQVNLTEVRRGEIRLGIINAVSEERMIIFEPKQVKRTITVFTDVDCPYCAKFHLDVPTLLKGGVRVRYLMFPLRGLDSPTYERSVSVWCADDRRKAIGIAKARGRLEPRTCPNPVADNYRLAQRIGVRGTPTIILDDGRLLTGYVPPDELFAMLGIGAAVARGTAR